MESSSVVEASIGESSVRVGKNKQTNKQVNGSRARHESIQGKPNRVQKGRKMGASGRGSLVKGRRRWRLSICSSLTHLSISSRLHRAGHRRRISLWNVPSPADGQLEPRAATCSFFFTPPAGFFPTFTEFYRVLPNFTEFYRVLPSFTGFYRVLPGFTEFYRVLPSFTEFHLFMTGSYCGGPIFVPLPNEAHLVL